jgi:hypothetical protein
MEAHPIGSRPIGSIMPDQMEILLEEMAILRQEIAHLHGTLEQMGESFHSLNVASYSV